MSWCWGKKKDGQDKMVLKAYNGRCVQSWLTDCLVDALEIHPEHEILVLTSSCMILGVMDQCDHDTSQKPHNTHWLSKFVTMFTWSSNV